MQEMCYLLALQNIKPASYGGGSCDAESGRLEKLRELLAGSDATSLHDQKEEIKEIGGPMVGIISGWQNPIDDDNPSPVFQGGATVLEVSDAHIDWTALNCLIA